MTTAYEQHTVAEEGALLEAPRIGALARLGFVRQQHPALRRAEAAARLDLAAALIALDTVEDRIAAGEMIHSANEQVAVEQKARAYTRALADLLRGMADSYVQDEEAAPGEPEGDAGTHRAHATSASHDPETQCHD